MKLRKSKRPKTGEIWFSAKLDRWIQILRFMHNEWGLFPKKIRYRVLLLVEKGRVISDPIEIQWVFPTGFDSEWKKI